MKSLLLMALIAVALSANAAPPSKRARLLEMFEAMRVEMPQDAPQIAVFERRLTDDDIAAITAFYRTPAGRHLAAASEEINHSAVAGLEADLARSKQRRTMTDLRALGVALETYALDHNGYPAATTSIKHVMELLTPKYLARTVRLDAWGNELVYIGDANHYRIVSLGPDGRVSPDSLRRGIVKGDFGDDLIFQDGEFIQPKKSD